ncbi:3' terminal RNA ribose 2'-O-methyltransferase Hen1 [Specibacter cremeus]|uniref:3' terminal RNA ribose 2'-O-methyltransferase Hen1 n=1 Tax=Specibacter cremeus TaxID=1629051 RepID=UPI000F7ADE5E|nr:3' terminal RNA ribose 2'-O-methyltransferase Hen1 [Specibacter cremeus]
MYVTITATGRHAGDLTFLLHKHPDRVHVRDLSVGRAHAFTTELQQDRCTVALLLEVDPVGLVRGATRESFTLGQYVNDRPYAVSSLLVVAVRRMFSTALARTCAARPELVDEPLNLAVHLPALPSTGGETLVRDLFEPLGWTVDATALPLDPAIPAWGRSRYLDATLTATLTVADALAHLVVLLPVLDDAKHYWVDEAEIAKLQHAGGDWLATHPQRDLIAHRYLAHRRDYVDTLLERLGDVAGTAERTTPDTARVPRSASPSTQEPPTRETLAHRRRGAVLAALRDLGAATIVDMGCGPGALLGWLVRNPANTRVVGADVSAGALAKAERGLNLDRMPDTQRAKLALLQSSLTYRDDRLAGFDAMVLMEVVEHLDADRLPALERNVFAHARPRHVLVTTPNREYNVLYPRLTAGGLRHTDHRFEWTRAEFSGWAEPLAAAHGYTVRFAGIGDADDTHGTPTQMAVFTRKDKETA